MSAQAQSSRLSRVASNAQDKTHGSTATPLVETGTRQSEKPRAAQENGRGRTRLYIRPLTAELLPSVLGGGNLPHAQDLFLSSPSAFPENTYGFVTLPSESARRLRGKLHNSVFQGAKMKVEEARSDKQKGNRLPGATETGEQDSTDKRERRSSRRNIKDDQKVLSGREIQQGKHVKRGWTGDDSVHGRKRRKSGENNDASASKVLFRAKLNERPAKTSAPDTKSNSEGQTIVVKEFENSTKYPTFLREADDQPTVAAATSFVEGRGWVDDAGNVVEAVRKSRRTRSQKAADDEEEANELGHGQATETIAEQHIQHQPDSTPEAQLSPVKKKPSALEALFKRPSPKTTGRGFRDSAPESIDTASASFTFFDTTEPGTAGHVIDRTSPQTAGISEAPTAETRRRPPNRKLSLLVPPQTPFTRRDLDDRALRSAAPTPDTAAIGRRFRPPWRHASRGTASTRSMSGSVEPDGGFEGNFRSNRRDRSSSIIIKQETIEGSDVLMHDSDETNRASSGPGALAVSVETVERNTPAEAMPDIESDEEGENLANEHGKDGETKGGEAQDEFEQRWYEERGKLNRSWKARRRELKKHVKQSENRRGKPRN